ncbi:MAG: transcriptional regulator [Methanobacteriaceae archaeon]|jgi:predicted transcriptional regulator|uniref:transcriptional regulator n=1 Tax=unclassified Methanobrevibacter TaxID=2638681 RepID=UPI003761D512|nr:transcriptional regulator [Methanobacteriaceae archaeon]
MKPPCEMVVWYVIPAIRSELAKDLLTLGMKQKKISELMDITQPAVSQYITDKRGSGIEFSDEVNNLIQSFAQDLYDENATKYDIIPRTCNICKKIKAEDILCQIHKTKSDVNWECHACLGSDLED